jgi:hypothetical protein
MSHYRLIATAFGLAIALGACADWRVPPQPEPMRLAPRDVPNVPNPVTPSAANETAPRPERDPTNTTGIPR